MRKTLLAMPGQIPKFKRTFRTYPILQDKKKKKNNSLFKPEILY
jgi:hypothetical protein